MNYNRPLKKRKLTNGAPKKALTRFRPNVRSRHPSHRPLRTQLGLLPFKSVVRLGSTWQPPQDGRVRIEVNSTTAVQNSANKLKMKRCFDAGNVKTAKWYPASEHTVFMRDGDKVRMYFGETGFLTLPVVAKSHTGSRGRGNTLIKTSDEYRAWAAGKNLNGYIVEQFHNYNKEYRLHVTKDRCFYTNRKMLRQDVPENKRWIRNDSTCTWIVEDNPQFEKPTNWPTIVQECIKALNAVGLDVGACDVKVQSQKDGRVANPDFFIIEINSAPAFGRITLEKYLTEIPQILTAKRNGR